MKREDLLLRLDKAERLVTLYLNKNKENRVINRVKKFLRQPLKYAYHLATKSGLMPTGDVTAHTFWGGQYRVRLSDENAVNVYYCGSLGRAECRLTRFLVKHCAEDDIFYDIGANFGFYSALVRDLMGPKGEVHAFEPSPVTMEYVRDNARVRDGGPAMYLNNYALSDAEGTINFFDTATVSKKSGMSTMMPEAADTNPLAYETISVPTKTLDSYIETHKPPTFIKLDVEGAESRVLAGATRLLAEFSPTIAMEVWDAPHILEHTRSAIARLTEAGYRSYAITPNGDMTLAPISLGSLTEFNIFVFRK